MSQGERVSRTLGLLHASYVTELLRPICDRIEIAGSLRREKPDIGDIEIVAIPKPWTITDLFGNPLTGRDGDDIAAKLVGAGYHLFKNGDHLKTFLCGPVMCELYLTIPECWGVIFMIRTGNADFSKLMVTSRQKGGMMPSHLHVKDGRVWAGEKVLDTPEEENLFTIWGIPYIEPKKRNA